MPLVGGGVGGAGNALNPTGTGTSLNYIGEHAYAYSGGISTDDNYTMLLQFTTGEGYILAKLQPALLDPVTDDYEFRVKLDSQQILSTFTDSYKVSAPYEEIEIIIPAYSKIEIEGRNRSNTNSNNVGMIITGRVYA